MNTRRCMSAIMTLALGLTASSALAVVSVGPGGKGVTAGNSLLINQYDYTDTWTIGAGSPIAARQVYPVQSFPLPAGVAVLENSHGNPGQSWSTTNAGSIATDASNAPSNPAYPGGSGAGSATGFTQRGIGGEGNFTIPYALANRFVVQTDAVLLTDRMDIFINNAPIGGSIVGITPNVGLGVFFRDDGDGLAKIGVYNGVTEVNTGLTTGLAAAEQGKWHNYAVAFDLVSERLAFYVDEVYRGSFNYGAAFPALTASNAVVGIGGAGPGQDRLWTDNFQVGEALPAAVVQYRETFTLNGGSRVDGTFNNNGAGAYNIEQNFGNPPRTMTPFSAFSFQAGNATLIGALSTIGNPGTNSGVAETGGGDFHIVYGLSKSYIVSADAILPAGDRFDILSSSVANGGLFNPNSLNVFFRRDGANAAFGSIGIHNGAVETLVLPPNALGISDNDWHNFAVWYDNSILRIYVDHSLRSEINLLTFAGGIYANYSNAAVGAGGTFLTYFDNFQVAALVTIPEPATLSLLAIVGLASLRRRRGTRAA